VSFSTEYAGLGGDKKWWRHEADGSYFYGIVGDLVLRTHLNVGKMEEVNGQEIPSTQKYYMGGFRTLRGYDYKAMGPKKSFSILDKDGVSHDEMRVIGGLFSIYGSLELEHPLAQEAGLKWVVFLDAGNTYEEMIGKGGDNSIYSNYGLGIRWFSPIGILRFEFGWPLREIRGADNDMKFAFDIGQIF